MPTKTLITLLFILFTSFSQLVWAKTNSNKSELTVEADESLEWFEKEKYYLAKGNVILKKDGVTLKANTIKADYIFENGENILKKIIAEDKVVLTKENTKATGQYMTYNLNDNYKDIRYFSNIFISIWIRRINKKYYF